MLRGVSAISVDKKGRLALPTRYRDGLINHCDGQFVCTIDHQLPCLALYPVPEWEVIEDKLAQLSSFQPAERRLQRLLLGHAFDCEMDSQGRLLLSAALRQYAGLEGKAMLVGQLNKFEIWDEQTWQAQIRQDMDTQAESTPMISERLANLSL
ncbi:division/cell wall cluster transcriptional repressor MraZ [Salinivibrio kushneri]|uniref:division/cell wall cluster transcriptional repressor MraZ n=1 Tax=Salinivibrio kushneri TaxID=1908198 RepID=UPI000C8571C2|nr:division/cell wall cluster transcriptional repressor MraZ [Salinivibrio kushneri]